MRLKHITFTGIDTQTDISYLQRIQKHFPIAEFGILTSYYWFENGNRFVDTRCIKELKGKGLNLALHVCGSAAHDAAEGKWEEINHLTYGNLDIFKRIQLNIAGRGDNPLYIQKPCIAGTEVIIQNKDAKNTSIFDTTLKVWPEYDGFSMLLDASGGRGINTELKVYPSERKIGYAGGFGPQNVEQKLSYLLDNVNSGEFWIDMETNVRTHDWFDLDKVVNVLEKCNKIISQKHF